MSLSRLASIRAQVEERIPGALRTYERSAHELIRLDMPELEGIPRSALTQICAPPEISSGKTSLLLELMADLTAGDEHCALVDGSDAFDPLSAETAGVDLRRVFWVRCRARHHLKPVEQAFKCADILLQNGGFGLIAVDLGSIDARRISKVPLSTWFRFARVVESMRTALVFLVSSPVAQSCAALTVYLRAKAQWSGPARPAHAQVLSGLTFEVESAHGRLRKPVQSIARDSRPAAGR